MAAAMAAVARVAARVAAGKPSLLMWYAAGDGDELAEDGHVAQDGEQHGLADLEHDLIFLLVAGLPWKVGKA